MLFYTLTIKKNKSQTDEPEKTVQHNLIWIVLKWITCFKQMSLTYYNLLKFSPDLIKKHKENQAEKHILMLKQSLLHQTE